MVESRLSLVVWHAVSIKSSGQSRKMLIKWRFAELLSALFSFFGILSATAEYEFSFSSNRTHSNCEESPQEVLRILTLIFTGLSVYFLIVRHKTKRDWRNKKMVKGSYKSFGNRRSMLSKRLVVELGILSVFPYPFLRGNLHFDQPSTRESSEKWNNLVPLCYNLSEVLYIGSFLRLFFIFRAVFNFTPFQDDHARYYCEKIKTRANFRFSLRAMMKTHPLLLIYAMSIFSFLVLGVIVRVFERPYSDVSGMNFESFENSIWNMAITMATVGYGDLYPCTTFGRIFGVIGALWGSFVFSMIVFSFQRMFQLDTQQKQAFLSIKQTRSAARVIIASLHYQVNKKKFGFKSLQAEKAFGKILERLKKLSETMRKLRQVDTFVGENRAKWKFLPISKQISVLEKNLNLLIEKKSAKKEEIEEETEVREGSVR